MNPYEEIPTRSRFLKPGQIISPSGAGLTTAQQNTLARAAYDPTAQQAAIEIMDRILGARTNATPRTEPNRKETCRYE